ncbi:MAG: oligosaccharide flippase family protein, partial [Clostridiales bacterium]|nr:oligosaccharide flippase family protein [Clostridiales bacterium]
MQNLYKTTAVVTIFTAFEHFLGFLYRIILSRTLGSEGLGVYQVALTVFAVFLTVSSSGLPITLSRIISKHRANGYKKGERAATSAAIIITLSFSVPITLLLFLFREPFSKIFTDPRSADLFYILIFGLSFTSVYAIIRGCFWGNRRFFAYSFIELVEEMIMIVVGVVLIVFLHSAIADVNKAAIAVLVSYLCSFTIAVVYFFVKGGKLASPKGELLPLLKSSMPVTTMRTSSSLINSLISVIFPMRLIAAGMSSAGAMSEFGVVYGMVMPILMTPSTLVNSLALVLVPEISECYYKKQTEKLSALLTKALNTTLLVAFALV